MSIYLLEPLDTQFHRTTLPFDAGTDGFAETNPFPWPRTVYGAIRAEGLSTDGISLSEGSPSPADPGVWGTWDHHGSALIKGPFLYRKTPDFSEILLPMPADLVVEKSPQNWIYPCVPDEGAELKDASDCKEFPGLCFIEVRGERSGFKVESRGDAFLLRSGALPKGSILSRYLTQTFASDTKASSVLLPADRIVLPEPRVGIGRSGSTHAAREGLLFSAHHHRLNSIPGKEEIGLWVHLEDENGSSLGLSQRRVLRLGGEGRTVFYRIPEGCENLDKTWTTGFRQAVVEKLIETGGRLKLYLVTPGIFDGCVHPFQCRSDGIFFERNTQKARLVGAAVRRALPIGGWDIRKRKPKPLETAVPAGSVFFLKDTAWPETLDKQRQRAEFWFDSLNFHSLSSHSQDLRKEGFGIALVGGWHV